MKRSNSKSQRSRCFSHLWTSNDDGTAGDRKGAAVNRVGSKKNPARVVADWLAQQRDGRNAELVKNIRDGVAINRPGRGGQELVEQTIGRCGHKKAAVRPSKPVISRNNGLKRRQRHGMYKANGKYYNILNL